MEQTVLGFHVKASVDGKNGFQPISQKFASVQAARDFCELAVKEGFKDAFVTEVMGFETKDKMPITKTKRVQPPITEA